jgi:DNA replication protein DnaC
MNYDCIYFYQKKFIEDVNNHQIEDVILKKFEERLKRTTGQSEIDSWRDSLPVMSQVLSDSEIPDNVGVLIEYMIPQSSFRVDFIIIGMNNDEGKENVVIVELKRWSDIELSDKDGIVKTRFKGGLQETSHPSYQSWSNAAFLSSFNETIYTVDINLKPCAYLHNYKDDGKINNKIYGHYIQLEPVFLKADKLKLREFIKLHVKKGDTNNIMYRIENGKIKPLKALADSLVSMLKDTKEEFIMLDDQKVVYETAISGAKNSSNTNKNVLIVEGGPGTGKTVVAINLLVGLNKIGKIAKYVTKNAAPRAVYKAMLTGNIKVGDIDFLFTGSGSFIDTEANTFDTLIIDEAHRLNTKSGMFSNLGENQIKEIINASKFSVFFIDED